MTVTSRLERSSFHCTLQSMNKACRITSFKVASHGHNHLPHMTATVLDAYIIGLKYPNKRPAVFEGRNLERPQNSHQMISVDDLVAGI